MACNHGSSWLSPYKQPLALKREPLILRTKTVARVPGASAALDDDTKGHIWHRCVVKNTPEMWRYIALMLQTSMWMFHIWLAECFPLETSLEWREDVTADSGTAVSIRPKQARQRQRDSRWKQISLEKNLVRFKFSHMETFRELLARAEPSDLRSGSWYRTLAKRIGSQCCNKDLKVLRQSK